MKISEIVRTQKFIVGATAAFSALGGAVAGYLVAQRKLEAEFEDVLAAEIKSAKLFYSALHKTDDFSDPVVVAESLGLTPEATEELKEAAVALQKYQGEPNEMPPIHEARLVAATLGPNGMGTVEVVNSVFDNDEDYDLDDEDDHLEDEKVDISKPFIITSHEFMENEAAHTQVTVTYFEGDDVVSDERDQAVSDVDDTIGNENLQKFGKKSNDPNVVYVRNFKLGMDFEVLRSRGKFTEEVLGFIEHSDSRNKIRKFRGDDE